MTTYVRYDQLQQAMSKPKIVLRKYPAEDFTIGNYKILFGGISCLLGAYAHYGVGPWPGSRNALIFCVVRCTLMLFSRTALICTPPTRITIHCQQCGERFYS